MFKKELQNRGILIDDPRFKDTFTRLNEFDGVIEKTDFVNCVAKNIAVIEKVRDVFIDSLLVVLGVS